MTKPRKGINLLDATTIVSVVKGTAKGDRDPKVNADGGGLYIQVTQVGASWIRRFTFAGVRRVMGLGAYPDVSLATAREKSAEQGSLVAQSIDPIKHRDALLAQRKAATAMTFQTAGERYFEEHAAEWRRRKTG